ncbi:hypothetical protein [Methylosinus sp. Sm6]|uniref:hypothetical protein n=1 Tax=Methylosinus sp. Sm6 TaxID=2866948 RepID=UPI001C9928CF|nr:hypothetical protein [Methylosinus sp. Sm6]MBY6243997.1 hypothetical protein [Methylosinus sp. Sm6]
MSRGVGPYSSLPLILRQIAEASSLDAAMSLAAAKGGTRIYVPRRLTDDHWLIACMGRDGARALAQLYGGEDIVLPADPRRGQHARVRAIRRGIAKGEAADEIAQACNVTRRQIFWHKARMRDRRDRRQKDLFDE